ncbi:MAG: hypothetical protein QM691_09460 [Opitutaceae bacterium]
MSRNRFASLFLGALGLSAFAFEAGAAPVITQQPQVTLLRTSGQTLELSVSATGAGPLVHQWRRRGVPIPGATGAQLHYPVVQMADAGFFDVVVGDGSGEVQSVPSRLFVAPVGEYPNTLRLDPRFDADLSVAGSAQAVVSLPDGRYYVAGAFLQIDGAPRSSIARFNADGSLDDEFAVGAGGIAGDVLAVAVQADGKVVIGGAFTRVGGLARNRIARLNVDGSPDTSFAPGYGCDGPVRGVAVDAAGRILVCGEFGFFNGSRRQGLVRLSSDGQIDYSFFPYAPTLGGDQGSAFAGMANCLVVQSDGLIVLGGSFTSYNGTARRNLVRLNADGTLDSGFDPGAAVGLIPVAVALQSGGRIVVGGAYGWGKTDYLLRLNADGSVDPGFGGGANFDGVVCALHVDASDRILVGGAFGHFGGTKRTRIARLASGGSLDLSFDPGAGFDDIVRALAISTGGDVLVGGCFGNVDSRPARAVARLSNGGAFLQGLAGKCRRPERISAIEPADGGRWLVEGDFSWAADSSVDRQVRLSVDGEPDSSFVPGRIPSEGELCRATQPDGKLLVARYGGIGATITRFNLDGSVDATFDLGSGFNSGVNALVVQGDGRIVAGGAFASCNGSGCSRIVRLNHDGSIDTTFNPGTGFDESIMALAVQPDGRIVAGGFFQHHDGHGRNFISRLNADGSFDSTFDPGTGFSDPVHCLLAQNDGQIVVTGDFSSFNNALCSKVVRLNADGSRDAGFHVDDLQIVYPVANPIARYTDDGRLLVSGVYAARGSDFRGGLAMFTASQLVGYEEWIGSWSLAAGQRGVFDTPAGDGMPNLLKFALGVPPLGKALDHAPTSSLREVGDGSSALGLLFSRKREANGVRLALEGSENLKDWIEVPSWTEALAENPDGTLQVRMSEAAATASAHRFIRLKVSRTEP